MDIWEWSFPICGTSLALRRHEKKKTINGICVSAARENKISCLAVGLMSGSLSCTLMSHPVEAAKEAATSEGVQPEFMSTATNQLSLPSLHQCYVYLLLLSPLLLFAFSDLSSTCVTQSFSVLSDISFSERYSAEPRDTWDGPALCQGPSDQVRHIACVFIGCLSLHSDPLSEHMVQ